MTKTTAILDLIDIHEINKNIVIDLKYATKDNFTKQILYNFKKCYLRKKVAIALSNVQIDLEKIGLGLKIWDGFRPLEIQQKLWDLIQDERYVFPPSKGGKHTRGTSVDVTLVDKNKKELNMPTKFDEFVKEAASDYVDLSPELIYNRDLLSTAMQKHEFNPIPNEWWHFDFVNWNEYEIIKSTPAMLR